MNCHIKKVTLLQEKFPTNIHYPFSLPVFNLTNSLYFDGPVTIFAGENGTGKSTLLEALAYACEIHIWKSQGGARCTNNAYEEKLYQYLDVDWSYGKVPGAFFGS